MSEKKKQPWTAPTRRAFVGMIAAGAAALVIRTKVEDREDDRTSADTPGTRWIGHC